MQGSESDALPLRRGVRATAPEEESAPWQWLGLPAPRWWAALRRAEGRPHADRESCWLLLPRVASSVLGLRRSDSLHRSG